MRRALTILLAAGTTVVFVVAGHAAQKIVAGHVCGGGGSASGGGLKLVGSIPASAAGRSSGGAYRLTGGFVAAAQTWSDSASGADQVTGAGRGMITSLSAVPAGSGAQITFTLSAPATVEVHVLNIAGRPVRTVASGQECGAGLQTLIWSGVSDAGLRVPNGLYVVELSGKSASGSQTQALATVRIGR